MGDVNRLRASALCVVENRLLMVRLEDPVTHRIYLFPPGGGIEPGESAVTAAERETFEETGYRVRVDPKTESVLVYPFRWGGLEYDCTTHFFHAALIDDRPPAEVHDTPQHRGVTWYPVSDLERELSYHPLLSGAVKRLLGL